MIHDDYSTEKLHDMYSFDKRLAEIQKSVDRMNTSHSDRLWLGDDDKKIEITDEQVAQLRKIHDSKPSQLKQRDKDVYEWLVAHFGLGNGFTITQATKDNPYDLNRNQMSSIIEKLSGWFYGSSDDFSSWKKEVHWKRFLTYGDPTGETIRDGTTYASIMYCITEDYYKFYMETHYSNYIEEKA